MDHTLTGWTHSGSAIEWVGGCSDTVTLWTVMPQLHSIMSKNSCMFMNSCFVLAMKGQIISDYFDI